MESFEAEIVELDFGRMVYHIVCVPKAVHRRLAEGSKNRVIGTVGGAEFRGAMLPTDGRHYLLLSQKYLKKAGLKLGDTVTIQHRADDPDAVELVPEFERALEANQTAHRVWQTMTPGARRGIAYRIASAKRPETRLARIEEYLDLLCEKAK
jgi:Bacteriocin-protection, YdeI or OmpD-Associated/Domain of unknown function (DUF1905)